MTQLLVVGANGQVGRELCRSLSTLGDVVAATRNGTLDTGEACRVADLSDPRALAALVEDVAPSAVVNAAAYTSVDKAEGDRKAAFVANGEAPGALARACAASGIPFVHYSTDYVFDGQGARPYREDDPTSPLGVYGASKLAGEHAVRTACARHFIFRIAWIYGGHGHNFLRTMLRAGAGCDQLRVVADQVGSPTPAALVADATAIMLSQVLVGGEHLGGTWHLATSGETSWHGFAEAIFEDASVAGLLAHVPKVVPITTADYPMPARRPAYSRLDTSRFHRDFGIDLPDWRPSLRNVITELAVQRYCSHLVA
ncbi:dTDP-4-dehydrorhamnose reductase [Pseudoxanthomonas daejeonensis]|uniref:dTDP-4-dehydrorhamnose reductase n=1 Tax=Pseudoxanthomonas daejeonensis TaxID=266062 RepID=A0ABQ6ZAQ8_9GAMM|nr:dTDP-4-dehydrorhamnose reductase [Pseudoxanthomonas daejeonensis]KAF1696944.1 dTDP-4-dehydrorhamnose reductase [Pseudoxanthomonas daejeonensis]